MLVEFTESGSRTMLVPITHSEPGPQDVAIEVPEAVRRSLGLDDEPQWVILDEVNRFTWPGFDLRPLPYDQDRPAYGFVPPLFFDRLRDRLLEALDARRVGAVNRD